MNKHQEKRMVAWDSLSDIIDDFNFEVQDFGERIHFVAVIGKFSVAICGCHWNEARIIIPNRLYLEFRHQNSRRWNYLNVSLKNPQRANERIRKKLIHLEKISKTMEEQEKIFWGLLQEKLKPNLNKMFKT